MRILVTGANGQVGCALRSVSGEFPEVDFVFCDSQELDIVDTQKLEEMFEIYRPDYCLNLAAYTAVDQAEEERDKAFSINAEAVKELAAVCRKQGVVLVHISTDFVFDGQKTEPYTVADIPNPLNVYGASKRKGEAYIQALMEEYYIVRTSWVYSDFGHNFKQTMLKLAREKKELNVVDDQIGCPTDAVDLAHYLVSLAIEKPPFGLYHYCGDTVCSWYEFAVAIFKENNIAIKVNPIPTSAYPTKAKRPRYSVLR